MFDRLKHALEKARDTQPPAAPLEKRVAAFAADRRRRPRNDAMIAALPEVQLDLERLHQNRVVTLDKADLAYVSFDVMRTRILKVLQNKGWFRVGVTSPTKGCGKSVVSANLAFSMARQPDLRTCLIDMDLRTPSIAKYVGLADAHPSSIAQFLRGDVEPSRHLLRYGQNLVLALNTERVRDSAEICHNEATSETLDNVFAAIQPNVAIFDLPPMLAGDDVIAFLHNLDCVVLIVAAGMTTSDQIDECEQLFGDSGKFLGVILNKSRSDKNEEYYGSYA